MKNIFFVMAIAFIGNAEAIDAPNPFISEPYNYGTKQERLDAVIGCMEDEIIKPYVLNKVQLQDEYNAAVEDTYHSLLKQGHGRVQARKSAEAIWFELGEKVKAAQNQTDNAIQGCAKMNYNIDLK